MSDEDAQEMAQMRAMAGKLGNGQEDEQELFERSYFPMSFGKQVARSSIDREAAHQKTRRPGMQAGVSIQSLKQRFNVAEEQKPPEKEEEEDDEEDEAEAAQQAGFLGPARPPLGPARPPLGPARPPLGPARPPLGPPRPPPASENEEPLVGPPPASEDEEPLVGPPRPTNQDEEEGSDQGEEDDRDDYHVPLSNEIALGGHTKVVSSLAVDPTGSRVLTGSYDYTIKMYDFQGMDSSLKSFRQIEPFEGHQVRAISWSPTADRFLAVTGSAQAKIYDRDGLTLGEFVKGDMYIRDLKHTSGHISGLTCGQWHPNERVTTLTCSEDGSVRIWDITNFKSQKQVIKPKLAKPGRVAVTACAWRPDGKSVVAGLADGSIQIWDIKAGWGSRPDIYLGQAHASGDDVTCVRFSNDGHTMVSRSTDSTMKVWDIRQGRGATPKSPLKVFSELPNLYAQTNVAFSPDERLILTGTSVGKKGDAGGQLFFFDKQRLELVRRTGISPTQSVVRCYWHPRLNQIFATTGDKVEGKTHVLYDPLLSIRGALVCVGRAPRKKSVDDFEARPVVRNPHALPMFRDEPSRKRQREKARSDPVKSRRPDLPITGPGHGGRLGTTKGSLLTQYLLREGGLMKETWMEEDPREAILKYAEIAKNDPKFIAPAYAETQPEPVFAEPEPEEEEEGDAK